MAILATLGEKKDICATLRLVQMSRAAATMQSTKGSTSTRPLLHGSGSPHISHLWRKHQSAPIIPLIEVHQDLGRLRWHILLNEMARFGEDLELIFPCRTYCQL